MKSEIEWERLVNLSKTKTKLLQDMLTELKKTTIIFSEMGGFCCCSCFGDAIWIDDTPSDTEADHKPDCNRAELIKRAELLV